MIPSHTTPATTAGCAADLAALLAAAFPSDPTDDLQIAREELDRLLDGLIPPVGKTTVAPPSDPDPKPRSWGYRFVHWTEIRDRRCLIVGMSMKVLYSTLEKLSFWRHSMTGRPHPYPDIRVWSCAINLRLNELWQDFPALRPNRRPHRPAEGGYTVNDTLLVNDRQMIDLEWLRATIPVAPRAKHRHIFETDTWFDFEVAERFVSLVGSIENKLEDLRLSDDAQFGCMALCSDRVRKRREAIFQHAELLEAKLVARTTRGCSRFDPRRIPEWRRDFIALKVADGSPAEAAGLCEILFGAPASARHMTNRKRELVKSGFTVETRAGSKR